MRSYLDMPVALLLLVLAAPVMVLAALAIRVDDRGPVFHSQRRTGRHGSTFRLWKFRTMRIGAEAAGTAVWAEADDPRCTRVGRWLRRTGIDELPQLYNVLVGEMSLVGPRPERPEIVAVLEREIPGYRQRLAVNPGITGWAQLRHSPDPSIEGARRKLDFDREYIAARSIRFDLVILLRTPVALCTTRRCR